jgi:hypothetical protein
MKVKVVPVWAIKECGGSRGKALLSQPQHLIDIRYMEGYVSPRGGLGGGEEEKICPRDRPCCSVYTILTELRWFIVRIIITEI